MSEDFKKAYNDFLAAFKDWEYSTGEDPEDKWKAMKTAFDKMIKEGKAAGMSQSQWVERNKNPL